VGNVEKAKRIALEFLSKVKIAQRDVAVLEESNYILIIKN